MPSRSSLTLAAVVALCGFLLVAVAVSARAQRRAEEPRKAELVRLIDARRALLDDLEEEVRSLRQEVEAEQERVAQRSTADRQTAAIMTTLSQQAGTTPVEGPGLSVRLSDSKRTPRSPDEAGAYRIHDTDLQLTVNALFAAGADAVAVNGSRIVATSPIRAAGDTIVVNFRPVSPPYRVEAIGADREAFAASEISRRFARWTKLFGLGFRVREERELSLPAYTGRVVIGVARPMPAG